MALYGSRSSVSNNNLTPVSRILKCDIYDIRDIDNVHIINTDREENYIIASVIRDLLIMKYDNMYIPEHQRFLNNIDIQYRVYTKNHLNILL